MTRLEHDWYPAAVPDNVEWGEGSWIYSSYGFRHFLSAARPAVSIGRNTGIYHPAHFDLGPEGYVRIGDNSTLLSVIICSNGSIQIGDLALIAHGVVIADDPVAVPGPRRVGARITLGDNVWVGANAILLDGADIGDDSVVGAGSVIDFEVPAGHLVAGNPARLVRSLY